MKKIIGLFVMGCFTAFAQPGMLNPPSVQLKTEPCLRGCVANRAFLRIKVVDPQGLPIENADVWLNSLDKTMQKHFTTTSSGLYETFLESDQFELLSTHKQSSGSVRRFLPSLHQDSMYFLSIIFYDVKGTAPQVIEPLVMPDPEPMHDIQIYEQKPHRPIRSNETLAEKPVIYLYGKPNQKVELKLMLKGNKLFTYPKDRAVEKNKISWEAKTTRAGEVNVEGRNYPYLFWDAVTPISENFEKGFCVSGEKTVAFLEEKLLAVGLNQTEITDFIIYWAPRMEQNAFNRIRFYQNEAYADKIATLTCTPKPDVAIRIYMVYQPVRNFEEIVPQEIVRSTRDGFVLVEWGGTELKLKR